MHCYYVIAIKEFDSLSVVYANGPNGKYQSLAKTAFNDSPRLLNNLICKASYLIRTIFVAHQKTVKSKEGENDLLPTCAATAALQSKLMNCNRNYLQLTALSGHSFLFKDQL